MEDILAAFPDRETFDRYWEENYVPVTYEDVKEAFEDFVTSAGGHIFLSDYKDNLSQQAQLAFQDGLTEVFYDTNPDLYETAFAIFEEAQMSGNQDVNVAVTFHETFNRLYAEFLDRLFEEKGSIWQLQEFHRIPQRLYRNIILIFRRSSDRTF